VLFRTALIIASLVAFSCGALAQGRVPIITLRRTACLGTCPVYSLEFFEDGFIRYIGTEFVQSTGERRTVIPRDAVENLVALFLKANYLAMRDSYDNCKAPDGSIVCLTDLPTTFSSLRFQARQKSVRDYMCAPKRLRELEDELDRVANTQRWIGNDLLNVPAPKL